ncbi:hypothetical protein NDU88_010168 [Pleurodeles waltl]|uniref:Uncharacterized protein n=1 Tax=Pleurodeles waltl TaxID=8319 RepID=A0AAV7RY75_PLEWA|nr:hypothetical protein NDU88_010168 [Pleurodeles waltl]
MPKGPPTPRGATDSTHWVRQSGPTRHTERPDHTRGTGLRPSAVGTHASRPQLKQLKQLRAALGGAPPPPPAGEGTINCPVSAPSLGNPWTRGAILKVSAPRCNAAACRPRPQALGHQAGHTPGPPTLAPASSSPPPLPCGAGRDPGTSRGGRA